MLDLYKNIKKRRLELKMSQDILAQKTGYTDRSSIAKIENGNVDLSYDKILLFAQSLDIKPEVLMGYSSLQSSTIQLYPIEEKIVTEYRKSDDYTKDLVHRVLKIDVQESSYPDIPDTPEDFEKKYPPVYTNSASCSRKRNA